MYQIDIHKTQYRNMSSFTVFFTNMLNHFCRRAKENFVMKVCIQFVVINAGKWHVRKAGIWLGICGPLFSLLLPQKLGKFAHLKG